jgi:hypothetical protein
MQMPEATSEHAWLLQLVGNWDFDSECQMGPDQPPMKSMGQQATTALGALWSVAELTHEAPDGQPVKSIMMLGYDPARGRFIGTFAASCMTHLWLYDGQLDATRKILTLDTEGPCFSGDGSLSKFQDIIEIIDQDHYVLRSQLQSEDGSWVQFMKGDYTRRVK